MLRIACPGAPASTPAPGGTLAGLARAAALGITAMEIEWVQSVPKNPAHVTALGKAAREYDIALTVHAPYFINLSSDEPAKIIASEKRILDALSMAQLCGAVSVCVHAAFNGGNDSLHVTDNVRRSTERILALQSSRFPDVNLAYETMGKQSQWGTLEEVLAVSKEYGLIPCLDPAHMHARANGGVNTEEEWEAMLDAVAASLGTATLQRLHMHFSGIAYGDKGEKHHLPLEESDANWKGFLRILKRRQVGGILVCESPLMEVDTVLLQKTFETL